ncbi:PREDICTED: uncharacterized protein LOC106750830 [Dinoponera quadriceps]|uniref:Uncharacterized protein LOC106750830 n=1 Tax=Dinoponera quadriceps TaxID=609295 RepID=A0A6P3Y7A8_DINQU|nr:PREDICTED: uncharacterized protein LOC106750830 [Dinoponera quadriceps]
MDAVSITTYLPSISYSLLAMIITTLIALYYYVETDRTVRLALKLPNPPRIPILGHILLSLKLSPEEMLNRGVEILSKYGTVLSAHFGSRAFVFLTNPHDIEIILSSSVHLDKSMEYRLFKPWLGDGLLITSGAKWRKHRKAIAPTFHMSILKTFVPLFYENSLDLVKRLREKQGQQFDCHDYLSAVTVDILTETAMGVSKKKRQNTSYEYAMAVMKLSDIVHRRHYDISLRVDQFFQFSKLAKIQEKLLNTVHSLTENVIQVKWKDIEEKQKKETQEDEIVSENTVTENDESNNANYTKLHYVRDDLDEIDESDLGQKKRLAFLDMLMDMKKNGGQMTDEEIWEEVNTIMFEGHDTTAAGSSFALCALGSLPEIQARVHEELDSIFGDSDRQCTFQDTIEMKYLERVILETLRLFPPVPMIARKLNEDVKIVTGNYVLPKHVTVVVLQYMIHRMEEYYPNPLVFNPDNFLPEKMQQRHYYAFIPFSAGPRSCVGRKYAMLKLKVLLSTILRNYRVISKVPYQNFVLRGDLILKRGDGFNITLEPRSPATQTGVTISNIYTRHTCETIFQIENQRIILHEDCGEERGKQSTSYPPVYQYLCITMDTTLTISYLPNIGYSLLATIIVTLIALYYYVETKHEIRLSMKIPHPPRVPILGHTLLTLKAKPEDVITKGVQFAAEHGEVISGHLGPRAFIFLMNAQDIEVILSSSVHIEKAVEYRLFEPWLGDGLLITTGAKWRKHRKAIAPTFHRNILKTFVPLIYENSLNLVKQLRDKIGQQFDCHDYLSTVTVNILTETVMGVSKEKRPNTGYDYAMAVMKLSDIVHRRHYDVSLRVDQFFKFSKLAKMQEKLLNTVHSLTESVIQKKWEDIEEKDKKEAQTNHKKISTESSEIGKSIVNHKLHYVRDDLDDIDENDAGDKKRLAFLEMLMDMKRNNGQMTDEEIWEEVNTIMFEGHDTTAAGSSFALCVLGCLPEIQARVHEELDLIFGDSDRQCTFQDTVEMKYLERVILETLRLFPPVPVIARKLDEDVKIVTGNYVLPKNSTVLVVQFAVHRSEKYYPNPLVFNPDNFLPEKMQQRHYYAFIPFSAGPRSCVGRKYAMLKLKVLLSTILRNYRVISKVPYQDFVLRGDIILKRSDGFNIKIESRKPASQTGDIISS